MYISDKIEYTLNVMEYVIMQQHNFPPKITNIFSQKSNNKLILNYFNFIVIKKIPFTTLVTDYLGLHGVFKHVGNLSNGVVLVI